MTCCVTSKACHRIRPRVEHSQDSLWRRCKTRLPHRIVHPRYRMWRIQSIMIRMARMHPQCLLYRTISTPMTHLTTTISTDLRQQQRLRITDHLRATQQIRRISHHTTLLNTISHDLYHQPWNPANHSDLSAKDTWTHYLADSASCHPVTDAEGCVWTV
jgi:hypothetical protein